MKNSGNTQINPGKISYRALACLVAFCMVAASQAIAQDTIPPNPPPDKWSFLVEPYLMFPNMNGTTSVSDLPEVHVDATAGDIFSHLQLGLMFFAEARTDKWSIGTDVIYMDLSQDVEQGLFISEGELNAKQFAIEFSGMNAVTPWLEVGLAGIVNSISLDAGVTVDELMGQGPVSKSASVSKTWFEPMIVIQTRSKISRGFMYQVRGEIGGFGIGSILAWQLRACAGYRFSDLFHLTAGYRIISLDYENGNGQDRFVYDIDTFGPEIRIGFNF